MAIFPWTSKQYVGKTEGVWYKRADDHAFLAWTQNRNSRLDFFHRKLRSGLFPAGLWFPIRTHAPHLSTSEILQDEFFWIRTLSSSLNTVHGRRADFDSPVVFDNPNRARPLKWVRFQESDSFQKRPGPQSYKQSIVDHLAGNTRTQKRVIQAMTQMIRRPQAMNTHIPFLKSLPTKWVIRVHTMSLSIFSDVEQRVVQNVLDVFWKFAKVPVIPLRAPKSLNPKSRSVVWRSVILPWMRRERIPVVKWRDLRQNTPNLVDLLSNHSPASKKYPSQRRCVCDQYKFRNLPKLQGHILTPLSYVLKTMDFPEEWTSRCRPFPSRSWTSRVWTSAIDKVRSRTQKGMKNLASAMVAMWAILISAFDIPTDRVRTEKMVYVDDLLRVKKFLRGLVAGVIDKGGGDMWVA